jgi:hypothetical protein
MSAAQSFSTPTIRHTSRLLHRSPIKKPTGIRIPVGVRVPPFPEIRTMKTINAAIRSNGNLAFALASRRDNGLNPGSIKRQSSRQMRQRLTAELRQQVDGIFLHAAEVAKTRRIYDRWSDEMARQFGYAPNAPQQVTQAVRIVRKVPRMRELADCF